MNKLFLFNPENDIALGLGMARITPPRQAALLHKAGAMLPFWLGDEGDYLLVDSSDLEIAEQWRDNLGVAGPKPVVNASGLNIDSLEPFGWSLDAISQFERVGVNPDLLEPRRLQMARHRELSHRRISLKMLQYVQSTGYNLGYPMPIEATTVAEVLEAVDDFGSAFLKSPWSSSGRGVFPVNRETLRQSISRVEGIIRNQGSIMVEPQLQKIQDFAMLFNGAEFVGYSLFYNSTATNYGGNFVASDDEILARLSQWVPEAEIELLRDKISAGISRLILDNYSGALGVDMMIYNKPGGEPGVAPCVEINLRTTMGFVAGGVYRKLARKGMMAIQRKGEIADNSAAKPLRLAPANPWFDFLFCE